jgi:hypothetical protein
LFDAVRAANADVYVTADLRHHPAVEAREAADFGGGGRPYLLDVSHAASEWGWLESAARRHEAALGAESALAAERALGGESALGGEAALGGESALAGESALGREAVLGGESALGGAAVLGGESALAGEAALGGLADRVVTWVIDEVADPWTAHIGRTET